MRCNESLKVRSKMHVTFHWVFRVHFPIYILSVLVYFLLSAFKLLLLYAGASQITYKRLLQFQLRVVHVIMATYFDVKMNSRDFITNHAVSNSKFYDPVWHDLVYCSAKWNIPEILQIKWVRRSLVVEWKDC